MEKGAMRQVEGEDNNDGIEPRHCSKHFRLR